MLLVEGCCLSDIVFLGAELGELFCFSPDNARSNVVRVLGGSLYTDAEHLRRLEEVDGNTMTCWLG